MDDEVCESDWKWFRQLHRVALQRFCDRILGETKSLLEDAEHSSEERFIAIYNLMQERNREMAAAFDSPRRLAMIEQLVFLRREGLLTDDEFFLFSRETCDTVTGLLG